MEQEMNEKKNPKKKLKKQNLMHWIIILLLLILVILFIIISRLGRIEHKEAMPTGNIDIFDIIFGNVIICQHCGAHDGPTASHALCASCGNKLLEDGFLVFDKEKVIAKDTLLNIFTHPSYYIVDGYIAPGSQNSYQFVVRNNNEFAIKYALNMIEHNELNLNMKYKLKLNGKYIAGSVKEYVNAKELKCEDLPLMPYTYDVYTLEWKWIEAENDTEVGIDIDSHYRINLNLSAEEVEL